MATDIKKFLDQQGVSTLWGKVVAKVDASVKAEADRAKQAEQANADAIAALGTKVGTLPEGSADVIAYINKKTEGIATDAALSELQNDVTELGNTVDTIYGDYLTSVDEAALTKLISDEADRADKAEKANAAAIKAISDDYLKAADKTELTNNINTKADQTALDAVSAVANAAATKAEFDAAVEALETEDERIAGLIAAEKERAEGIEASLQTQINTIMNNPDAEGAINSINEFTKYVEDHGEIADGFRADINKNKEDIAAMDTAYKAADAALKAELEAEIEKKSDITTVNGIDGRLTEMEEAVAGWMLNTNGKIVDLENADSAMAGRLDAIEEVLGDGEGSVSDQIADAKQEAIDAAAADATSKANTAESNAKAHADSLNTAMNTRVEALEAIDHDHSNKEVLDGITANKVTAWDAALQAADIITGTENGTISVKGTDVAVKGLGSAAYVATSAFDVYGSAAQALTDAKKYSDDNYALIQSLTTADIETAIAQATV